MARVPGPWYSQWTSAVLDYKWLTGQRPIYVHYLHEKYGPVVRIAPNEVDVTDMESVKAIYNVKETFKKSSFYRKLTSVRTPVLFALTDVEERQRLRRLLGSSISASALKPLIPLVVSRIDLYIQRIKEEMEIRGAADIFKWNLFLATDVVGELSFGESFRTLELGEKNQYVHVIENIGPLGALRYTLPTLTSLAFTMRLPFIRKVAEASQHMRRYGEECLGRYYRLASSDPDRVKNSLFKKLFNAEEREMVTFEEICANAQGYILAGSDTTASTLTYLIWSVCRQPYIRSELIKQLETLPPTYCDDNLRKLPYLNYVIDETLRLYSAAPSGLPREVPPGGADIAGYWLKGGSIVCAQAYSLHRNPTIFPNPEKFDPSRWQAPTRAMTESFLPFSRGPRICIGLHLAQLELRLAAARFFLEFPEAKLSTREGFSDKDMSQEMFFVSNPTGKRCLIDV
ncbi:Cytochrome P450 [Trichoderma cornu-damae]|uniref:Cytochrome P450 n=1 Tax=Trichoderma cornu-damae TaxID=654480 RepID=A0A9P8TT75_9HYPO|nr:Cytochrome P450 [Trichoderma cornu-damae]